MIKVKTLFGWSPNQKEVQNVIKGIFCNNDFVFKDLKFVQDDSADFFVIFGKAPGGANNFYKAEKTIFFQTEPNVPIPRGKLFRDFSLGKGGFSLFPGWYMRLNYNEVLTSYPKTKILSGTISNKGTMRGQQLEKDRNGSIDMLSYYDHYGRGMGSLKSSKGSPVCKSESLKNYSYHFNAENIRKNGWITEKIIDPILMETLVFFDGCPDIDKYVDPEAYIKINLDNFGDSKEIIEKSIRDNEREKRLSCILNEKKKWMTENLWLNVVWKIIHGKI